MCDLRNAGRFRPALLAALCFSITAPSVALAQGSYHLITQWKVGGEGGWDYIAADARAHRVYVTHGGRVEVLDTGSGKRLVVLN